MAQAPALILGGNTGFRQMPASDTFPAVNIPGAAVISATVSSDQNDFAPTGWADADIVRITFDSGIRSITGLTAWTNGKTKTLLNVTNHPAYVPIEHPDSSSGNQVLGEGDWLIEPFGCMVVMYDSTSSKVRVLSNSFNAADMGVRGKGVYWRASPGSTNQSDHPSLGLATAGTGASNQNDVPTTALPAAWGLVSGTTSTGASQLHLVKNALATTAFGAAHLCAWAYIYIPTLSTSAQRFMTQLSITASANGTTLAVNNSVGIRHNDNTNSGKWQVYTRNNAGSESTADSGITVVAGTLYALRIWVNKARTEARYFITDGTNSYSGRLTGTMPNAVTCGARIGMFKSVGTTSRTLNVADFGHFAIY